MVRDLLSSPMVIRPGVFFSLSPFCPLPFSTYLIYYPQQYVHCNLPTQLLDPIDLWKDYPHIPLAGTLKFYYLTQTAFYLHQVLILNAEARRKDHLQMMTHHVITVVLMTLSYYCNFTRVGCLIMVLMDWCDIFLPVSISSHLRSPFSVCFFNIIRSLK